MPLLDRLKPIPTQVDSFVFEMTADCNHACAHCYNAWKAPGRMETPGVLPTAETLAMLDAMIEQTGASLVTLSGGEPTLRQDFFEIVDHLFARGVGVNLISNGSRLDESAVARLAGKVRIFELPLLGATRETHDRVSGRAGAFDDVTAAIARLKAAGQSVVAVFVATRENLAESSDVYKLAFALGCDGLMWNRFNPGGGCDAARIERLQATPAELTAALDEIQALVETLAMPVSCSIAMPPCLLDHSRWPSLGFGFCAAGTQRAYYTLDPVGKVRPCNHSTTVLGNLREQSFRSMVRSRAMRAFKRARPAICKGCRLETTCQGGCKAAAEVCFGDVRAADPFLAAFADERRL